ncbi:MAG: TetR/AcrR family transcriptional regulator [Gammaproteobacteria bacterium]
MAMQTAVDNVLAGRILDTALALAETRGSWEALRLHDVAEALDISLAEVHACYAQKDDLAEAWFDRADRVALRECERGDFAALPPADRLERVILAWLEALAPHRRLTRGMLAYKLEPGHLHLQLPGLVRISRTVQWFREAAWQDSTGVRRILEEAGLTLIYVRSFTRWLFDETPGAQRTRQGLARDLRRLYGRSGTAGTAAGEATGEVAQVAGPEAEPPHTTGSG